MKKLHSQQGIGHLVLLLAILVLGAVGGAGYVIYQRQADSDNKQQDNAATSSITPTTTPTTATPSYPQEIARPDYTPYKLKSATPGKITVYDFNPDDITTPPYKVDKNTYVTFDNPKGWAVYESVADGDADPFVDTLVYVSPELFVHIDQISGVGGSCDENTDSYTLLKKLATKNSDLYFVEYKYSDQTTSKLKLENFNATSRTDYYTDQAAIAAVNHHLGLKEGQSNTNDCLIGAYSFATNSLYVTVSNKTVGSLGSSVTWDDIKNNSDLVTFLQSMNAVTAKN